MTSVVVLLLCGISQAMQNEVDDSQENESSLHYVGTLGSARLCHRGPIYNIEVLKSRPCALSCSEDGTARLWDLSTGNEVCRWGKEGGGSIYAVALLPGEKECLIAARGGKITQWSLVSGKEIGHFEQGSTVYCLEVCANGRTFVAGSDDGKVILWDLKSGEQIRTFQHSDDITAVAVSPDGRYVLGGGSEDDVLAWDLESGEKIATLKDHSSWVCRILFSPDGTQVASSDYSGKVKLWSWPEHELLWEVELAEEIPWMEWSPDQRFLVAIGTNRRLYYIDPATSKTDRFFDIPFDSKGGFTFSAQGDEVLIGGSHRIIRWDCHRQMLTYPQEGRDGVRNAVRALATTHRDQHVLVVGTDFQIHRWELERNEPLSPWKLDTESTGWSAPMNRIVPCPSSRSIFVASSRGMAMVDGETGALRSTIQTSIKQAHFVESVGKAFYVDDSDGQSILAWNPNGDSGNRVATATESALQMITPVAGQPLLLTGDNQNQIQMWHTSPVELLRTVQLPVEGATAYACQDRVLLVGTQSGQLVGMASYRDPDPTVTMQDCLEWLPDLNADQFARRQQATQQLIEAGPVALEALETVEEPSAEVAYRISQIRHEIELRRFPTFTVRHSLALDQPVHSVILHPSGSYWAALVGDGANASVVYGGFDEKSLRVIGRIKSQTSPCQACFTVDGKRLLVGSREGTVDVYQFDP